jgi:6-pyruvoyltetrahydropterin/6-carboxytetrahydropterin synthase
MMSKFQSTKLFDGFSTVFRQWRAKNSHCQYLHGYGISFRLYFEGDLDKKNWVWDFGGMKRSSMLIDGMLPKTWMEYMFDHTCIIAEDDPELKHFQTMADKGLIQLRILPDVGAERFAEFIYQKINPVILNETEDRVRLVKVEFFEHDKNSAIYLPD